MGLQKSVTESEVIMDLELMDPELTEAMERIRQLQDEEARLRKAGGPASEKRLAAVRETLKKMEPLRREWARLRFWTNNDGTPAP